MASGPLGTTRSPVGRETPRVASMRLIVTSASVILIIGAVIAVAGIAERTTRRALTAELETRLVLEARNLALVGSQALRRAAPDFTLNPYVSDMVAQRPELAFAVVVDRGGLIQAHPEARMLRMRYQNDRTLTPIAPSLPLKPGESLAQNADYFVAETPIRSPGGDVLGRSIVGLRRDYVENALIDVRGSQVLFLLPIVAATILVTLILMSGLLRPISVLRAGLERIGRGDLDVQVELSSLTEMGLLAGAINEMSHKLRAARHELVEKGRLDHEMSLARHIQQSLLPRASLEVADFVIAGRQRVADEVGGDYFNVFPLAGKRIAVVIADVAGKGLAGCLITSMLDVLIRTLSPLHKSPRALLLMLEASLIDSLQPGTFVTVVYGILDTRTGGFTFASAAHNPLLHYKAKTGDTDWYRTKGIPLGLIRGGALGSSLVDCTIQVEPGDLLLDWTDGFNEAANARGEEYGFERLETVVRNHAPEGCAAVADALEDAVDRWERGSRAMDDKTLLLISRAPAPVHPERQVSDAGDPGLDGVERLWRSRADGKWHIALPAKLDALADIGPWIRRCAQGKNLSPEDHGFIEQGLFEICANIAEHGCGFDGAETIDIWWISNERAGLLRRRRNAADSVAVEGVRGDCFLIRDRGKPPSHENWPVWDSTAGVPSADGRGMGLSIIYKLAPHVEFHANTSVGNVTIVRFTERPGSSKEDE